MGAVNENALQKVLERIIERLQQSNKLPQTLTNEEKNTLVQTIVENVRRSGIELNYTNLAQPGVQKMLTLAVTATFAIQNDPFLKAQLKSIFGTPTLDFKTLLSTDPRDISAEQKREQFFMLLMAANAQLNKANNKNTPTPKPSFAVEKEEEKLQQQEIWSGGTCIDVVEGCFQPGSKAKESVEVILARAGFEPAEKMLKDEGFFSSLAKELDAPGVTYAGRSPFNMNNTPGSMPQ